MDDPDRMRLENEAASGEATHAAGRVRKGAKLAIVAAGLGVLALGSGILWGKPLDPFRARAVAATWTPEGASLQAEGPLVDMADLPVYPTAIPVGAGGVPRRANPHTLFPDRPRVAVVKYLVQPGDSLFGIAERFGLKPSTILWGNWDVLEGDPHSLRPGQDLNILPVDGAYYEWHEGDTLLGVARFFKVEIEEIIDWPGNGLAPDVDPLNPDIEAGTWLVIPEGRREVPTWSAPRISRSNPAAAKILGPGYCGSVASGPTGRATFVWPTPLRSISGFGYDPDTHSAIDIGGAMGHGVSAADTGVVVFAGWNNWGYGLVIVLDRGNGWQTLYAHLSQVNVGCGQAVFQGQLIGLIGCSGNCRGPHLHFEMMSDLWGKVNPLNFLP